jgi:hypothetical protein
MSTTSTKKNLGDACITNASCESNRCEGVCVTPKHGDPCSPNFGCASGYQCEPLTLRCHPLGNNSSYNGACGHFRDCKFDEYCSKKQCAKKKSAGMKCDRMYECGDGLMCSGGVCTPRCHEDGDCAAGFHCENRVCTADPAGQVVSRSNPAAPSGTGYTPYIIWGGVGLLVVLLLVGLVIFLVKRSRANKAVLAEGFPGYHPQPSAPAGPTSTITGPSAPPKESSAGFESSPAPIPIPDDLPPAYEATTTDYTPRRPSKN